MKKREKDKHIKGRKSQAATEYLIILAIVIIVALIVVAIMGGLPTFGGGGKVKASESYWGSQIVSVDSYSIAKDGNFKFLIKNLGIDSIRLDFIQIGRGSGVGVWDGDITLTPGANVLISSSTPSSSYIALGLNHRCSGSQQLPLGGYTSGEGRIYEYSFYIRYIDSGDGATKVINGDNYNQKLVGICASSI